MPLFMRRHYEVLAAVLRSAYDNASTRQQIDGIQLAQRILTATLRADNPRFDTDRFVAAIRENSNVTHV